MKTAKETTTWTDAIEAIRSVLEAEFGSRELSVLLNGKMIHVAARDDRRHMVTIGPAGIRGQRPGPDGPDGEYEFWTQN